MITVDDDETEQTAFMSMVIVQQPVAKNNFRIMTLQNNVSVLGDYCILYQIQKFVGEDDGESIFDSMRIPEQIPRMYFPKRIFLSCDTYEIGALGRISNPWCELTKESHSAWVSRKYMHVS
jgi:hypothetical protein